MPAAGRTYFFLHLMKTGGTSFLAHMTDNFAAGSVYRAPDEAARSTADSPYASMHRLRAAVAEGRDRYRAYAGHLPHLAVDVIRPDVTITILRHPVDRAISMLRQVSEAGDPAPLEQIYEENPLRWMVIQDYQARQFALTAEELEEVDRTVTSFFPEQAGRSLDVPHCAYLAMDDVRLERAIDAICSVEVVGLQSRYQEMLSHLRERHGWRIAFPHVRRVAGARSPAPESLRKRIADDNAYDIEFYERVVASLERRAAYV